MLYLDKLININRLSILEAGIICIKDCSTIYHTFTELCCSETVREFFEDYSVTYWMLDVPHILHIGVV